MFYGNRQAGAAVFSRDGLRYGIF